MNESSAVSERFGRVFTFSFSVMARHTPEALGVGFLFVKIFERCHAFFAFSLVIQINGASLVNALFGEEFVPVASFVEGAGVGYRPPVKSPAGNLCFKRGARVALSRLDAAAGVYEPAEVFFFHF